MYLPYGEGPKFRMAETDCALARRIAGRGAGRYNVRGAGGHGGEPRKQWSGMEERVVLVDERDVQVGTMEKQQAHREGRLHRAFSVFVLNACGEVLLQRRAAEKYHSAGLWTNTCCSHPRPGEPVAAAARRRLREEMGIDAALTPLFAFTYRARVGPELEEHEYDHVFLARHDGDPVPDAEEVDAWRWVPMEDAAREAREHPEAFTPWFRIVLAHPEWPEHPLSIAVAG